MNKIWSICEKSHRLLHLINIMQLPFGNSVVKISQLPSKSTEMGTTHASKICTSGILFGTQSNLFMYKDIAIRYILKKSSNIAEGDGSRTNSSLKKKALQETNSLLHLRPLGFLASVGMSDFTCDFGEMKYRVKKDRPQTCLPFKFAFFCLYNYS